MPAPVPAPWPELDVARDQPTFATLHLVSQMLGKLRIAHAPWLNHGWHATLHPRPDGLAIDAIDAGGVGFELMLDLCRHQVRLKVSDGRHDALPLRPCSVAEIHAGLVAMLDRHDLPSTFNGRPSEIADAPPFADDHAPRAYASASAERLRDVFAAIVPVFDRFRAGFRGKASPVHFFWGAFDLAVTRFSGQTAPPHPGGIPGLPDRVTREAYSHEVSSAGFWAGGVVPAEPIFYSYAYPEPLHYREAEVLPGAARFDADLGEFVLPYVAVRQAEDPAAMLTEFLQSTYGLAADLGHWDRAALERDPVAP
ncbi:MAG: DUF5996 family protein [Pseudomonadota bacterium]|nr:DUF5996 family protein [Pseudomonadota bacterium]